MYTQFFAGYLLEEKYLSKKQIIEGLKSMKKSRAKLGVLAMNAGYLTAAQVERIHERQSVEDKRMGDIAVEMGYMTQAQVDELLEEQPSRYLMFAQTLVDKEFMDNSAFMLALNNFKVSYGITDSDMISTDDETLRRIVKQYYRIEDMPQADDIADYIILLFNNMVRFVGDDYVPLPLDTQVNLEDIVEVEQRIVGAFGMSTSLMADEITYIQFASRFADEEIPVYDDYSKAAGEDFVNLHNGLFLVNMSNNKSIELELDPPYSRSGILNNSDKVICTIPILFSFGNIEFQLAQ